MIKCIKDRILKVHNKHWEPKACISDFEKGFRFALKEHKIDLHGCKWHYTDAIKRRLKNYENISETHKQYWRIIRCTSNLFFAQSKELFVDECEILKSNIQHYYIITHATTINHITAFI
jgi:hypothetical protein